MMNKNNKYGITLIELIIVITAITALAALGLFSIRTLQNSFSSNCSNAVINSLLNSVHAAALTRQTYTGIRFQKQNDIQYVIFIAHNSNIPYPDDNKTIPFTAIEGHPPYNLGKADINEATIIFSSQGKLVRKWAKVFSNPALTEDDIFGQYGLFPQDTNSRLSDNSLIINSEIFYINSYMGTLIDPNR